MKTLAGPPILARVALLAAALLASACGPESPAARRRLGHVVINGGADPRSLVPGLVTDIASSRSVAPFMRGLAVLDAKGQPQPDLAESWTANAESTVFEIKIRPSRWSNGEPVTSQDFVYAWLDRMLQPKFAAEYSYLLYYIEGAKEFFEGKLTDRSKVGVEAPAPDRLRVRLVSPAPFFPQLLAHTAYFPIYHGIDAKDAKWALGAASYVADGPFKMTKFSPGDTLVGVRNEGYWNAKNVAMTQIAMRFIEDESTERIAFDNKELDGTYLVPRADIDALAKAGTLRNIELLGTYFLSMNMKREIFKDARVRRALALAIDRASIVKNVSRAGEKPALWLVPQSLYRGEPPKEYFKDADFAQAKRLLAEAGYPDGKGFPKLRYIYNTQENHRAIAQVIQESWKKNLGIEIEISNLEWKAMIDRRKAGDYDIARDGWIADIADPINFLDMFLSVSGNNNPHWEDPKFDAMVEAARREADSAARMKLLRAAEDYLMETLPLIPIYNYANPYLCAPDLEGYEINPMNQYDPARLRWKT